jgi:hypothetical protein
MLNRHSRTSAFNYHSEIWADKAGYFIYLPMTFEYGWEASNLPDSIAAKTGDGFSLMDNKVRTKYNYGVALLQAPFYLVANFFKDANAPPGFSRSHHMAVNFAGTTYLIIGLLLLMSFLNRIIKSNYRFLIVFILLFSTNLYYYGIDETGMSHVYSFFLFALYLWQLINFNNHKSLKFLAIGFCVALIAVIRPTNVLFVTIAPLIVQQLNEKFNFKGFGISQTLLFLTAFSLLILPQLLYWNYAFGDPLTYSYGNESFNWLNPQISTVLFAPKNGLFTYAPFLLVPILCNLYFILKKDKVSVIIFVLLFLITYIYSCWWDPGFGCSFGARSYVEYISILSIPLYMLIFKMHNRLLQFSFYALVILGVSFNLKMTYSYDGCFYGSVWDWQEYLNIILQPTK